jgi:hypothetical protein
LTSVPSFQLYVKPLREDAAGQHKLISKEDLKIIVSELEVIKSYTSVLLTKFEERVKNWGPNTSVGDCFLRIVRLDSSTWDPAILFRTLSWLALPISANFNISS